MFIKIYCIKKIFFCYSLKCVCSQIRFNKILNICSLGPRNLPSSGELLLPLPVLRAKVETKNAAPPDKRPVSKGNQSSTSGEKKRKLSPTSDSPSKSFKASCSKDVSSDKIKTSKSVNNSLEHKSSPAKVELCVVNKKKSHFNKVINIDEDKPIEESKEISFEVNLKSPEQIVVSDNELDFDDYEEINYRKKKKNVPMIVVSDSE